MKINVFVFFSLALASTLCGTHAALRTVFIEDLCFMKETATIDLRHESSVILMSVPRYTVNDVFKCDLTVIPQKSASVSLSIYRYDVPKENQLLIQDSDHHTISLIGWGTFKDEKKSILSDGRITIKYTKNNTVVDSRAGFQFTLTQLHDYPCMDNEYHCTNNKCILNTLACDGHNHCGDNSDQIKCVPGTPRTNFIDNFPKTRSLSIVWISAIAVASIVFFIIIVVFAVVAIRGRTKKSSNPGQAQETRPTGSVPLQSVSATVTPNEARPPATNDLQRSTDGQARETFYSRVRRSLRGQRNANVEAVPVHQETFQVPSMYPSLDQVPSAPELNGAENPAFKPEE